MGCYNNTHIRTQRIIEPGEKIISGNTGFVMQLYDSEGSYNIRASGISGFRFGFSYLGLHKGYEQGINLGLGLLESEATDITVGYDIRKVRSENGSRPYHYGLYVETNTVFGGNGYGLQGGTVLQLRPYIMTITSEQQNWYAGFHGIMSFGELSGGTYDSGYWDSNLGTWIETLNYYDYKASSIGAGLSLGKESRHGKYLFQSQLDLSLINQNHELIGEPPNNYYEDWNPLDISGPVVGISTSIRLAPPQKTPRPVYPDLTVTLPKPLESPKKVIYDPFTGQIVSDESRVLELKFDPMTGEPLKATRELKYDPFTGEVIPPELPLRFDPETGLVVEGFTSEIQETYSLLSSEEQTDLLMKKVSIYSLNGAPSKAELLDVRNDGLFVLQETYGAASQEIIKYDRILQIGLKGRPKGMSRSIGSALAGCGSCVAIGLGSSLVIGHESIISWVTIAPAIGLVNWIINANKREKYDLTLNSNPTLLSDAEYRTNLLLQTVRTYLQTDAFPEYDLTKTDAGGNP